MIPLVSFFSVDPSLFLEAFVLLLGALVASFVVTGVASSVASFR